MLRVLSDEEIKASDLRRGFLYSSEFTIDNLTAILMDSSRGGLGLHEETARAKAHGVLDWLRTISDIEIPERRSK